MNFDNNGGDFPPQEENDPYSEEMGFGSNDGYNGNRFRGRGGWFGGPPRRGRGGFNNNDFRPPPPNFGNWNNGPQFGWGRGFGPNGPPMQKGNNGDCPPIRYLLRCGVPRENLRNLPISFLQLIDPGYCGICDITLVSFTMSRVHYVSRNHYKNQQKWLFQAPAERFHHPKNEMPMKSRDLYCELCNVQITSKLHADSHYAGKQHRAVVEGRKLPKNPALMKKAMSDRLEQLIRREKRFVKPIEKSETPKEEVPKPFQPELYCDICKTSVTCTEQMTMHLNGKRHLSKEKQHILKMMKGDTSAEGKQNENVEEDPDDEACKGDPEIQAGEGEDKYDWGKGSAAWDENEVHPSDY